MPPGTNDLGISSNFQEIKKIANGSGIKIILSSNSRKDPIEEDELVEDFDIIAEQKAELYKLVCDVDDHSSLAEVFGAADTIVEKKIPFTVYGIGSLGHISSTYAEMLQIKIAYCSYGRHSDRTKPALDLSKMIEDWNLLKKK